MTRAPWPMVRLGDILRRSGFTKALVSDESYREITVKLWGRGVVLRRLVTGAEIASSRRFVARPGQLILSRIDARNGAIGVVPEGLDGAVVTNDFPLFDIDDTRALPQFLRWLTKTTPFVDLCRTASEGTTNRVRLQEDRFLGLEIPLPPLPEQRRIVAELDQLSTRVEESRALSAAASGAAGSLASRACERWFPEASGGVVGDFVRFQTGYAFKSEWFSEDGLRVARNANVGHGSLDWSETARIPFDMRSEFARFELAEGDILVSLDRPIISSGVKVARVGARDLPALLLQRVARALLQPERLLPEYLFHWLRSPRFVGAIDPGRSNGVPHISHKDIEAIPFVAPPLAEQRRVVAELDAFEPRIAAFRRAQAETAAELDALMPAILDRAFKGEL